MLLRNTATKKIFISYRVQDTAGETGRLVDALKQHFSDDQIFMDIENLEPGADFTKAIERSLSTCDVFLAVIGPHWLGEKDGEPRINNPNDWVRLEVGTALNRDIRVVPVLVNGGTLPAAEQLPEDLQPLLRRQSIEISNKRWRYDTDQLLSFLVNTAGIIPKKAPLQTDVASSTKKRKTWVYVVWGFLLCFVVLAVIGLMMQDDKKGSNSGTSSQQPVSPNVNPSQNPKKPEPLPANNDATENVSGAWESEDQTSLLTLSQNGSYLTLQVQANGFTSTGTGEITGRNIELSFPWGGYPSNSHLVLSTDGNEIIGTWVVQATGFTTAVRMIRKSQ